MILGSLLALVGTAVFCVAEAPWLLIVARLCQGASNGAVYSAGLPLIADTVSPDEVGSWYVFEALPTPLKYPADVSPGWASSSAA